MDVPFEEYQWNLAHGRSLVLGKKSRIMGILNVTPDSFSDGGMFTKPDAVLHQVEKMLQAGADIIDVGGESTRPGANPVDSNEEEARVIPVIKAIAKQFDCLISIDTYRAETAKAAIEEGAHIVNDVWGLQKEPEIAKVVAQANAGVVIMHTGRERTTLPDVIDDQKYYLQKSLGIADQYKIPSANIVLDPGFGFAKDTQDNIDIMARLTQLHQLNYPLLIGTSRKRFLGDVAKKNVASDRDVITAASGVFARLAGAQIFRVHNVEAQRDALLLCDMIMQRQHELLC